MLQLPKGIACDSDDNLYIADAHNHAIRVVNITTGEIMTVAGSGSPGDSGESGAAGGSSMNGPQAVFVDTQGVVYIADTENHRIKRLSVMGNAIHSIVGTGTPGSSGDDTHATLA